MMVNTHSLKKYLSKLKSTKASQRLADFALLTAQKSYRCGHAIKDHFNDLSTRQKTVTIGSATLIAVLIITSAVTLKHLNHHKVSVASHTLSASGVYSSTRQSNPVLAKLNLLENQIGQLQNKQSSTVSQADLNALNQNLMNLKQTVQNLQETTPQSVSQIKSVVTNSNESIANQLSTIKQSVDALKKTEQPRVYLPASTLPWPVVGVDTRNYTPVVVRGYGLSPIMLNEVHQGWKLVKVQFAPPLAVFQNVAHTNQYVKIQGQ